MTTKKSTVEQRLDELEKEVLELWEHSASDKSFEMLRDNLNALNDRVYTNTEFRKTIQCLAVIAGIFLAAVGFLTLCGGVA